MPNIVTPDAVPATTQGGTVYIKRYGDFSRFVWGGECVYIQDISDERGGVNVTTRANAREGGLKRDGVMSDPPGNVSTTLSMKRLRGDKLKTLLKSCFWIFDKRTQCNDFDSPLDWQEIERVYRAKVGTRTTTPGTSITDANAEDMVNFDITALEDWDIYRAHMETGDAPTAVDIRRASVCHGERCAACGDAETDAVIVLGASTDGANPHIFVSTDSGDLDTWTDITITEWGLDDVDGIACLGEWGGAVSNVSASVLYSNDRFITRTAYTTVDLTARPPNAIDASSQSFIVVVGDGGYIYISRDGLATCPLNAVVGAANLAGVKIAPSNSLVVYAWSISNDDIIKTTNGGDTWFYATTATGGGNTQSLAVHPDDENILLLGTVDGEIFQSTDGGETWTEQADLPGMTTKANVRIYDIEPAGGGVWFLSAGETVVTTARVYVNYEDGASGAWEYYNPLDSEEYSLGLTNYPYALAAVNPNLCVVGAANGVIGLLS